MLANTLQLVGLATDFAGVLLLGFDLVRLQQRVRDEAQANLDRLEDATSEYGGAGAWAAEIRRTARWINESAYSRWHAEDEVSYNARHNLEKLQELAEVAEGVAKHLSELTTIVVGSAKEGQRTAGQSLRFSIIGIGLVAIGFSLQLASSALQALN